MNQLKIILSGIALILFSIASILFVSFSQFSALSNNSDTTNVILVFSYLFAVCGLIVTVIGVTRKSD